MAKKGTFGYLKNKRRQVFIITIIMFAISASLFIAGLITTGAKENLLTIVAVLGCLPACKSLVSFIMYLKATGCTPALYAKITDANISLPGIYDLYFTSYKNNFPVSHMIVEGKNICGITEKDYDTQLCESHLETILKQSGYKDLTIKIFKDSGKYIDRLSQIEKISREPSLQRDSEIRTVLFDISL